MITLNLFLKKRSAINAPTGIPGKIGVINAKPAKPNLFLIRINRRLPFVNAFFLLNKLLRILYFSHHFIRPALKYVNKIFEKIPELTVVINTFKKSNLNSKIALGIPNFPKKNTHDKNTVKTFKKLLTIHLKFTSIFPHFITK